MVSQRKKSLHAEIVLEFQGKTAKLYSIALRLVPSSDSMYRMIDIDKSYQHTIFSGVGVH